MNRLIFTCIFFLIVCFTGVWAALTSREPDFPLRKIISVPKKTRTRPAPGVVLAKLNLKAASLFRYCKTRHYNSAVCFMVDISLHPGKHRFFVYSLKRHSVLATGLVTHGAGSITANGKLVFSNKPGSNCTSIGKYSIGKKYYGRFGLAYKLHGLDASNNKAFDRAVVLHAHSGVPEAEVYPLTICASLGCPTVSVPFLQTLKLYIESSTQPVILYIYN